MKNSCRVGICGYFGFGKNLLNGQTVKTKIVAETLQEKLGMEQVRLLDFAKGAKNLLLLPFRLLTLLHVCRNVIILPAQNSLRFFVPALALLNVFEHKKLHYIVIGGWLPDYLKHHSVLCRLLRRFDVIYTETKSMQLALKAFGLENTVVMPNCKNLHILSGTSDLPAEDDVLKCCTFSRVMLEKGIEDAVSAVRCVNETYVKTVCSLDIFGQIDPNYAARFDQLIHTFPAYIHYAGAVEFNRSTDVLKDYDLLLFPTYYEGEGFAGTIIDAFAAGLPVLASDWKYNREIVQHMHTGIIYPSPDIPDLTAALNWTIQNTDRLRVMRENVLRAAQDFLPEKVMQTVILRLS